MKLSDSKYFRIFYLKRLKDIVANRLDVLETKEQVLDFTIQTLSFMVMEMDSDKHLRAIQNDEETDIEAMDAMKITDEGEE